MRTLRGILIRSIALASLVFGSTVQAQYGQSALPAQGATAPTVRANVGGRPTFTPQPLYPSQALYTGPSPWNQSMVQPAMMHAPPGYGAMMANPAAYYGPPQPVPGQAYEGPPGDPGYPMGDGQYPMGEGGYPMDGYQMGGGPGYGTDGYAPGMDGGGVCPQCGGAGCGLCSQLGDGVLARFIHRLLPYGEGGACAPRWYDISVDALYWTRDEVSDNVPFTALTRGGPIVMSTDNLSYDRQPGLRLNTALQLLPGVALDFTYLGMFSWSANTSVSSAANELFSPYSNFGALVGVGLPFDESDQAQLHSLSVGSTIDSFELSARKYWTGPNCRLQGSYRSGVRYVYMVDDLNYSTLGRNVVVGLNTVPAGNSSTDIRTHNSLVGWQAGFDLWATIVPGIMFGTDVKAGVYGNHAKYNTHVFGSTTAGGTSADLRETASNNDIAVVGEVNLMGIYKVNPNWTIRGGYSLLYLDGVALAPENFNSTNPFNNARTVQNLNNTGNALYHGGFLGLEWMW